MALRSLVIRPLRTPRTTLYSCLMPIMKSIQRRWKSSLRACTASNAQAAYSQLEYFGEMKGIGVADTWSRDRFLRRNYIDAMALVRKSAWLAVGGYSQLEISGWEDYDFWCKFIEHDFVGIYVPEILCRYRAHKSSMINQETNPNVDLLTYEMIFRHPWLEHELNNASTPVPTSPDPVPAQGAWTHVTLEQMNLLTSQIESIYRSKSWRVTAPLRLVSNAARQVSSLIARAPCALVRRSAALPRREAPALYNALAKSHIFRRIYTAVSCPGSAHRRPQGEEPCE